MKTPLSPLLLGLAAILLTGCVQSYHPFYTEACKTDLPELVGYWSKCDKTNEPLWECRSVQPGVYHILTHDAGKSSIVSMVTFKMNNILFADISAPTNFDEQVKMNGYLAAALCPLHYLCKLTLAGNTVVAMPLNANWFKAKMDAKEITMPSLKAEREDQRIVTATTEQWQEFLIQYGSDTDAFSTAASIMFRKRPGSPPAGQ